MGCHSAALNDSNVALQRSMVYVEPALATPIGEHASMACRAVLPYSKRLCLVSFLKQERNYFYMYYFAGEIISILII